MRKINVSGHQYPCLVKLVPNQLLFAQYLRWHAENKDRSHKCIVLSHVADHRYLED